MAIAFQGIRVDIPSTTGRRNFYWESQPFPSVPLRAAVALTGFMLQYDGTDHHVKNLEVDVDFVAIVTNPTNLVLFRVLCNLADKNGDDRFSGYVEVLVIAELGEGIGLGPTEVAEVAEVADVALAGNSD